MVIFGKNTRMDIRALQYGLFTLPESDSDLDLGEDIHAKKWEKAIRNRSQ